MLKKDFVVLDVETTGFDPHLDEIIEVGLVRITQGEIAEKASWLINPRQPVPEHITQLTGITNEMLYDKPYIHDVAKEIENFCFGADLVAHNINFDCSFLEKYISLNPNVKKYDTLDISKILLPCAINYTLENVAKELNIQIIKLHRASEDANLTALIFIKFFKLASELPVYTLNSIVKLFNESSTLGDFFGLALKEKIKNSKIGVNENYICEFNVPFSQPKELIEGYKLNSDEIINWFTDNSPLNNCDFKFEVRKPQIEMAEAIINAINNNKHVVIEAGTGTGKSMAYLLPAAKYAVESGNKIAIATNTISLQEQLLTKDIPLLRKLGIDAKVALIKGRANYLCLRKLFLLETDKLSYDEMLLLAKIYVWLVNTVTGDRADLNISFKAVNVWRMVASESESCIGTKCKWFLKNCFFWRARRLAESSDIIILNHALLFSDLAAEKKILPFYNCLVIDEAHHVEKVASEHLGRECDLNELLYNVNKLLSSNKNDGYSVLGRIRKQILSMYEQNVLLHLVNIIDDLFNELENIRLVIKKLSELLVMIRENGENTDYNYTLRIKQSFFSNPLWIEIFDMGRSLSFDLREAIEILNKFLKGLEDFPNELSEKEQWEFEIKNYVFYFLSTDETINNFFADDFVSDIKWIEFDDKINTVYLKSVPFEIGKILKQNLYEKCDSIIFTSATITVDKKFDYFLSSTGLDLVKDRISTLAVGSTFNYEKQALVAIPTDSVSPLQEKNFLEFTIRFIENVYKRFKGRSLVLFTSHKHMRYVYDNINLSDDVLLLTQNISGQRQKILQNFCNNENVCLLGANTFWEGIDLPGDLLNLVIIVKLPFLPPTNPLLSAKEEKAKQEGKNSFEKISLPGAVIRFKQGFGRLIRRKDDKGAVVILDGRITAKNYGITFLRSLPIKSFFAGNQEEVLEKVVSWLNDK